MNKLGLSTAPVPKASSGSKVRAMANVKFNNLGSYPKFNHMIYLTNQLLSHYTSYTDNIYYLSTLLQKLSFTFIVQSKMFSLDSCVLF